MSDDLAAPAGDHPPDKWAVGVAAAALVHDDMVLGIGTGSTVAAFLDALAARRATGDLPNLAGVPTSDATAARCRELGIGLLGTGDVDALDLVVDGADELTAALELTKGGGGALLREKVVAAMGRRFVVIAGEDKLVERLGDSFALPIEVVTFALAPVARAVRELGGRPVERRDLAGRLITTDNGHALLDTRFPGGIEAPGELAATLSAVPGVAEHGLFLGLATEALLADRASHVRTISRA